MTSLEKEALDLIQSNIVKAKEFCRPWHKNIEHWRDLYNFEHYKGIPPKQGEPRFLDPTYTNTVDLAVGIFMANGKQWVATGWSPSKKEQKNSEIIEKYLSGVIEENSDRYQCDLDYEINLHFTRDGCGVLYSPWDSNIQLQSVRTEMVMDFDKRQQVPVQIITEIPIHTRAIDPLTIFVLPGGKNRWAMIARIESATVYDIECEYGVELRRYKNTRTQEKRNTNGEFIDYWDYGYVGNQVVVRNAVLFNDEFILHQEEPLKVMYGYKDIPYTISFYKPTSRTDPSQWFGILQPIESSVAQLEKNINRVQKQIDKFSSLPMVARSIGNTISLDPEIGDIVNIGMDDRIEYPVWSGNPPDVQHTIDFLRSRIQQSGFSDVMYGSGASSMSGYAISQLGDQGRIRLEQPITHLERLWTWWARKVIDLTQEFAAGSYIMAHGKLRGADFSDIIPADEIGGYNVRCEIKPEFPNERVRNHAMATQVRGIISNSTLMQRYLGIEQPEDEKKRILLEAAEQNPLAQQYALMKTLLEMAEDGDQAAVLALQNIQSANQGGRPEAPPNPMQPTGLQSSTGGPSPQARGKPQAGGSFEDAFANMVNATPNMQGGVE